MWAFNVANINEKILSIRSHSALNVKVKVDVPLLPARDALVLDFKSHPEKKGLSLREGQARMLHDLASIELQAMELCLRTLVEYPEAPAEFREELSRITLSESDHLEMCLTEIRSLGFEWGNWPINCGLWTAVSKYDSLINRILIVHRYLEGSGLDAGNILLRRLDGVDAASVSKAIRIINTEEVDHVLFGSRWYQKLCVAEGINPVDDFEPRMDQLRSILPRRVGKINHELRLRSGFSPQEIKYLEKLRDYYLDH